MLTILQDLLTKEGFHTQIGLLTAGKVNVHKVRIVAADAIGIAATLDVHKNPAVHLYPWHKIAWISTGGVSE